MTNGDEFRTYMKAANRTQGTDEDRHLSEQRVIAYCRGETSEAEREVVQSHLVECELCVALFRSANDFLEPAGASDEQVTWAEFDEEWQTLRQRVHFASPTAVRGAGSTAVLTEFQRSPDRKSSFTSRVTLALAASLLISLSAFGWLAWSFRQEREARRQSEEAAQQTEKKQRELEQRLSQVEQSSAEQLQQERERRITAETERDKLDAMLAAVHPTRDGAQVFSFTLSSDRGSAEELLLPLKAAATAVRMRLFRSKPYEFATYTIELLDQGGTRVWETSGIKPARADGALSLRLNRAKLSSGKYRLRLFGWEGKTNRQLGEYGLTVTIR